MLLVARFKARRVDLRKVRRHSPEPRCWCFPRSTASNLCCNNLPVFQQQFQHLPKRLAEPGADPAKQALFGAPSPQKHYLARARRLETGEITAVAWNLACHRSQLEKLARLDMSTGFNLQHHFHHLLEKGSHVVCLAFSVQALIGSYCTSTYPDMMCLFALLPVVPHLARRCLAVDSKSEHATSGILAQHRGKSLQVSAIASRSAQKAAWPGCCLHLPSYTC